MYCWAFFERHALVSRQERAQPRVGRMDADIGLARYMVGMRI